MQITSRKYVTWIKRQIQLKNKNCDIVSFTKACKKQKINDIKERKVFLLVQYRAVTRIFQKNLLLIPRAQFKKQQTIAGLAALLVEKYL